MHCRKESREKWGWLADSTDRMACRHNIGADFSADTARSLASLGTGASAWNSGQNMYRVDLARRERYHMLPDLHRRAPSPHVCQWCLKQQKTSSLRSYLRRDEASYDPWCHPGYRLRHVHTRSAASSFLSISAQWTLPDVLVARLTATFFRQPLGSAFAWCVFPGLALCPRSLMRRRHLLIFRIAGWYSFGCTGKDNIIVAAASTDGCRCNHRLSNRMVVAYVGEPSRSAR
jgi:hypothetical protein